MIVSSLERSAIYREARWQFGGHTGLRDPTPPFGGCSCSIPEGMTLDVSPLAKSLFCLTKRSPNGFFDFEASIPLKLDVTFWGRGVGGSKVCA